MDALARFISWAGRTGTQEEQDWSQAALHEVQAVPPSLRRAWLRGAARFLVLHRRPTVAQVIAAWGGVFYGLMLVVVAWTSLVDDAPDAPRTADVAVVAGGGTLMAVFLVASLRPLLGGLLALGGLPLYALFVMTGRQLALHAHVVVDPPPGYAATPLPAGPGESLLAVGVLLAVPTLVLLATVLPIPPVQGRPSDAAAS